MPTLAMLLRASDPPETLTVPVAPFSAPPKVAAPLPDTVSVPPSVVAPVTESEPPETLSEFALLMVSAAIVSLPLGCVTAKPALRSASSDGPGRAPPDQLAGVAQLRSLAVFRNVFVPASA